MRISFATVKEQLEYEIAALKKDAKEPTFAQYLCSVESRLIGNPNDAKELRLEMIKNYNIYAERMGAVGISVASDFHEAIYSGMDAPEVKEMGEIHDGPVAHVAPQPVQSVPVSSVAPQPVQSVPVSSVAPQPVQSVPVQQIAPLPIPSAPVPSAAPMPVQSTPVQPTMVQNINPPIQPVMTQTNQAQPIMQAQMNQMQMNQASMNSETQAQKREKPEKNKNRAEFAIGGIVLSVIGTVLILSGAIMLAVNFFDTLWQGICLYVICAALFLFSELFIRKFVDKLSAVLTSLAMSGVFVVTLVNYFALHIFNMPVTFGILLALSFAVGAYSYFRNSFLFTLIGYFASFLSLALVPQVSSETEIYVIYGIMLASGLLWTLFPIKKNGRAFSIIQVFANIFLVFWYTPTVSGFLTNNSADDWFRCNILLAVAYVVLTIMVMLNSMRYYRDLSDGYEKASVSITFYRVILIIANVTYITFFLISYSGMEDSYHIISMIISGCAVIIPNAIVAYVLYIKESSFWLYSVYALAFTGATLLGMRKDMWGAILVTIALMAAISVLSYLKNSVGTKVGDLLMKIYLFVILLIQIIICDESPYITRYICLLGALVAIGLATGYKQPIQLMMTGLIIFDACYLVSNEYIPVAITLILAIAVALFHNVKWFKSDNMYWFDIPVWVTMLVTVAILYIPFFRDEMPTVILSLIFGLAVIIQYFFERYNTILSGKLLHLGIFITMYIPIFRLENLAVSIILMCLALLCVALGFVFKQKGIRIYGLVLAMIVCAKIGFYDFWSSEILIKTIMFFVVGVLALVIAGVYIVVEKRMAKIEKAD